MDRYDADIIHLNLPFMEDEDVNLYSYMQRRWDAREVSSRYPHGSYHTNAPAIVLGSWKHRKKYIMCGTPGFAGRPCHCGLTLLCERCTKKVTARIYVRWETAFHRAQHWYALTYSFRSNIFIQSATQQEYLQRWKDADTFVRSLTRSGLIQGAFAVKEVSIASMHGMAIFPHTHVVMNSDRADLINEDGTLHPSILEEASKNNVSIKVQRITDSLSFLREVKYPVKPVNLKTIYQQEAINTPCADINAGLDSILARITEWNGRLAKITYYGNMDPRVPSKYIGRDMKKKAKTKELNSPPSLPTINLEQKTAQHTAMQPPVIKPAAPPQKKRSLMTPLLLGGAGLAGLGAADHFLNHGRASSALVDSIKRVFSPQSTQPTANVSAPKNVPALRPANNTADLVADAAAGYYKGEVIQPKMRDFWKNFTERHNPDGTANPVSVFQQGAYNAFESQDGSSALPAMVTADIGASATGLAGQASGWLDNPVGRLIAKFRPPAPAPPVIGKLTGLGRFGNSAGMGRLLKGIPVLSGATAGVAVGDNPLNAEVARDLLPFLSPEQAASAARVTGALGGGAVAGRFGLPGAMAVAGGAAMLDTAQHNVRSMAGNVEEIGFVGDMLARLHRGAAGGNVNYRGGLERVLGDIEANPKLMKAINGQAGDDFMYGVPRALSRLTGIGPLNGLVADSILPDYRTEGSPAIRALMAKSRKLVSQ